jgi:hypothetical protein
MCATLQHACRFSLENILSSFPNNSCWYVSFRAVKTFNSQHFKSKVEVSNLVYCLCYLQSSSTNPTDITNIFGNWLNEIEKELELEYAHVFQIYVC